MLYCTALHFSKNFLINAMNGIRANIKPALSMLLPGVLPIAACIIYSPVNHDYLVKRFGCGCHFGFNTNNITLSVFWCVFVLTIGMTVLRSLRLPGWRSRTLCIFLTFIIHGFLTLRMLSLNIWL